MKKKEEMKKNYTHTDIMLSILTYDDGSEEVNKKLKETKQKKSYKYVPSIKYAINTSSLIKDDKRTKIGMFSLCFIGDLLQLYSGGEDGNIYAWNIDNGNLVHKLEGHQETVTCLNFENEILYSGSADALIMVWNLKNRTVLNKIFMNENNLLTPIMIIDNLLLTNYNMMISILNNKTIKFVKIDSGEVVKTLTTKENLCCGAIMNSYGKLLCGTKEKSIIEFDLSEILDTLHVKHDLTKFPFMSHQENYIINNNDKLIKNAQVMNFIIPKDKMSHNDK